MSLEVLAGIVVGGAIGAPARYVMDNAVQRRTGGAFPWGTFVVNVTGSLVLGLLTGAARWHGLGDLPRAWLGTGFCGAYTTFSTFTFETVRLLEEGEVGLAATNAGASLLAGLAAAAVGLAIAAAV